ncbi:MAG: CPBP family intramembrane metalloprotease domain-containing protein [Balneola sp.]|nr:CPBP family intramembrane metalloprotease domain-containing protein [Balneola sp.]
MSVYYTAISGTTNGSWYERNGFNLGVMAIIWVFLAFIAFNLVGGIVGVIAAVFLVEDTANIEALMQVLTEQTTVFFWINTTGQITVFALGSLLVTRLAADSGSRRRFLRLQIDSDTYKYVFWAIFLTILSQPTVVFLGWLNAFLPVPEWMAEMQQSMDEMIAKLLGSENILWMGLFHIGLVPSICEEIMYRGYVQRSLEKSWGIWTAIILSGLIFGAYHLQITRILPLAALGILFAYITYVSNSLIPAMAAHLANNGGQVILSTIYPEILDQELSSDTDLPWVWILFAVVLLITLLSILHKRYLASVPTSSPNTTD